MIFNNPFAAGSATFEMRDTTLELGRQDVDVALKAYVSNTRTETVFKVSSGYGEQIKYAYACCPNQIQIRKIRIAHYFHIILRFLN